MTAKNKNTDPLDEDPTTDPIEDDDAADPAAEDDGLVTIENGGEILRVHPSCLAAHLKIGWLVAE